MVRKNGIWLNTLLLIGVLSLSINSCEDYPSDDGNPIQKNETVQDALKTAGITVYEGNTPPNLEGLYSTSAMKYYDACDDLKSLVGNNMNSTFKLYGQTTTGEISFAEKLPSGTFNSGNGAYITGSGQNFTIWQTISISSGGATALVFSGTVGPSYDLLSVKSLTVYTEATSYHSIGDWFAASGLIKRLDPPPLTPPTIVLNSVNVIPFSSVKITGKVSDYGSYAKSYINLLGFFIDSKMYVGKMGVNDIFSLDLSDITSGLHECYAFVMFNNPQGGSPLNYKSATQTFKIEAGPVLTTSPISSITQNSATCGANISSDAGYSITSRGVCWSTNVNPTISDNKTTNGSGTGSFISNITGLQSNTKYYVRGYAVTPNGISYGNEISFMSLMETVKDIDGNVYNQIQIGTQIWMVENLKVTKYRDGSVIPNIMVDSIWSNLSTGAYCDYDNTISNSNTYGRLYNWYAVSDSRNIAPVGWHIPTYTEWETLVNYLGGGNVAGNKMKETGITHWQSPNSSSTNESGFTALPGGYRFCELNFCYGYGFMGEVGSWWCSTGGSTMVNSWSIYSNSQVTSKSIVKIGGLSVRCIKD